MKKLLVGAGAAALALAALAPAAGASNASPGGACVQTGLGFLKANGLLQAAAQKQINYALIDSNGPGIPGLLPGGSINADLGDEAYLSLGKVVSLHATNPGLFDWCAAS